MSLRNGFGFGSSLVGWAAEVLLECCHQFTTILSILLELIINLKLIHHQVTDLAGRPLVHWNSCLAFSNGDFALPGSLLVEDHFGSVNRGSPRANALRVNFIISSIRQYKSTIIKIQQVLLGFAMRTLSFFYYGVV